MPRRASHMRASRCTAMAAIFNRLAYAGLAIAAVGGVAKTALYNGALL